MVTDPTTYLGFGSGGGAQTALKQATAVSFERLDVPPSALGEEGQAVTAAATAEDGTLVVSGFARGEQRGPQYEIHPELWTTRDLQDWHRAAEAEPALDVDGAAWPEKVVVFGDQLVAVGNHERAPTQQEIDDYDDGFYPLASDLMVWTISFEE
jgi:hypothetical protein